ncbi:thioredoxin domain-containing protein [Elioraea sp.]|uniref:thioredoxin domain-containing protein n=1 Tax=Elioraea sp. TaxID=2185103 RepID=UPI0025B9DB06|nr:thioredoxin domain-containing protein [Elioraea sp.]
MTAAPIEPRPPGTFAPGASPPGAFPPGGNRLSGETSPYLLQHADNPVHWRPWNEAALAEARTTGKPILLSVGYAACHWCHVMAHESFEDAETAALMNAHFVNIKVDREERPDIDAIYMHALHILGEQGGWPLTMFLTPGAEPFWGGTYFPPEPRYGRPSFRQVLAGIARAYTEEGEKVARNAASIRDALAELGRARPAEGATIGPAHMDAARAALLRGLDQKEGGLQGAPKFPQPSLFRLLWNEWRRTGDAAARAAVTLTLRRMSQGGIYDHLGGGFARYSTDAVWLVPHFEKMLYDNAQILELLALVGAEEPASPLWRARAEETVAWLSREMIADAADDGSAGFASTQDADSEGEEGKFAVWTTEEAGRVLAAAGLSSSDIDTFLAAYDIRPGGNWEGHAIPNRSHATGDDDDARAALLARGRAALLAHRQRRVQPGRDDKVLADWNGMMIAALCRAAHVFGHPEWIEIAARAFRFVAVHMKADGTAGGGSRLLHAWRRGVRGPAGMLADHAAMAKAAIALASATGDAAYLDDAKAWVRACHALFADADGAFFTTAADATDVIVRAKDVTDGAVPSGNGMLAEACALLWHATGDALHRATAEGILAAYAGGAAEQPWSFANLLVAADILDRGASVVITGDGQAADALLAAANAASGLGVVIQRGGALPSSHPGAAATQGEVAAAHVCTQGVCGLPLADAAALRHALAARGST